VLGPNIVDTAVLIYNEIINIEFDLDVIGTGMRDADKVRMVSGAKTCGEGDVELDHSSVTNANAGVRQPSANTTASKWQLESTSAGDYKICWCGLDTCNDAVHFYKHIATITIHDVVIADQFLLYGVPGDQNRTKMSFFAFQWVSHKITYFQTQSCSVQDSVEVDEGFPDFVHDGGEVLQNPTYYYSITCPSITYIPTDDPPSCNDHFLYWWHEAKQEWKDCNYDTSVTSGEPTIKCLTVARDSLFECHPADAF